MRALAALGLADEVVDRGMRIRRREYRNKAGRLLFAMDEEAFWGPVGPSVCLRRGDLLDILRASTPQVTPRWDTPVTGAELVDEGVRVQLESGPAKPTTSSWARTASTRRCGARCCPRTASAGR